MLSRRQGLSATAGLSCYLVIVFCFIFAFHSKLKLISSTNPSDHRQNACFYRTTATGTGLFAHSS